MSVDLQVVFPQEVVKITSVTRVPGATPPVLDVVGADFSAVDEILINDVEARDFAVLNKNRLYVTVPDGVDTIVRSLSVTSRRLVLSPQSFLRFRISNVPSKVSGVLRLVQFFVKILFTTPGTDIFNQRLGGAALKNLGRTFSKADTGGIVSDFVIAVENTSRQIIAIQGRLPQLPQDERLLTAKVTTATFSASDSALRTTVEITSQAGRSALAQLTM